MKYNFRQAVHLGGRDYQLGNQEVDEKAEQDPVFLKYVELGLIVDAVVQQDYSGKTLKARSEALLKKLMDRKVPQASAAATPALPAESDEKSAEPVEELEEKKPKHHHKKSK